MGFPIHSVQPGTTAIIICVMFTVTDYSTCARDIRVTFVLPSTVSAADPTSGDKGKGFGTASL